MMVVKGDWQRSLAEWEETKFCKEERPSCEPLTKSINSREGPTIRIFQPSGLLPEICVW